MTKLFIKLSLIMLLAFCLSAFAEYRIAKDQSPGGLYVVGPDISPDSLTGEYLYYSIDVGTTLVLKDSASYPGHYTNIGDDYTEGNIYTEVFETIYHSENYGETFTTVMYGSGLFTGTVSGEFYCFDGYCFGRANGYGDSFHCVTSWDGFNTGCLGWQSGELFLLDQIWGPLYYSPDTMISYYLICDFGYRGCDFIRKGQIGEIYGLYPDSIYYSADYGSTFVGMNTFNMDTDASRFNDIVSGNSDGELYGVYSDFYVDGSYVQRGGSIRICFSDDYGATFDCLTHTADGIIYETLGIEENSPSAKPEAFAISAYPNPFNSAVTITIDIPVGDGSPVPNAAVEETSPLQIEIYDVNGRRVADFEDIRSLSGAETTFPRNSLRLRSGSEFSPLHKGGQGGSYVWQPDASLGSGVYLVRARFGPSTLRQAQGTAGSGHRSAQRPDGYSATKRVVYLK